MILSYIDKIFDKTPGNSITPEPSREITGVIKDSDPQPVMDKTEISFELKFHAYRQHIEKKRFERELIAGSR